MQGLLKSFLPNNKFGRWLLVWEHAMTRPATIGALLAILTCPATIRADYLDLIRVTPGGPGVGGFTGAISGASVTGTIVSGPAGFRFNGSEPVTEWEFSTFVNTSPQYSYPAIYSPTIPLTDQLGYTLFSGTGGTWRIQLLFDTPIIDPVFHVANLDGAVFNFSPTSGLSSIGLLKGNGGSGDGLNVDPIALTLTDANPFTMIGLPTTVPPPTTGARSAYGSVLLPGTFSSLVFDVTPALGTLGDGGSFTLGIVPEPSTYALALSALASLSVSVWQRRR
jgi:hypothetical protein